MNFRWRGMALGVLALSWVLGGCSKPEESETTQLDEYVYEPVKMAAAYLSLIEKPDAVRALLIGEEARELKEVFVHAGVKPTLQKPSGRYDLVLMSCDEMSPGAFKRVADYVSEDGVLVWLMDVRGVTFEKLKSRLESFQVAEAHLWMPGCGHWVLAGRFQPRAVKLSAMLDVFTRENAFADFAKAQAATVPEMFASYVGTLREVMPVFNFNERTREVEPECFLTKDIPEVSWVATEGLDADMVKGIMAEIRSLQIVRRQVLEGKMLSLKAKDKKGEEVAIEKWHNAALRNPRDLMLLERLDRLDRNARGFLELGKVLQAMKCYETMVLIRPEAASVHNFGKCLEKIGKLDLAKKVFKRAEELSAAGNSIDESTNRKIDKSTNRKIDKSTNR